MNVNINLNDLIKELISKTTFNQIELHEGFEQYLTLVKQNFSSATYNCYKTHSETIIKDLNNIGVIHLNQIDDQLISKIVEQMRLRNCKNSTINKRVELLIRCYNHLANLGCLPSQTFTFQHLKETLPEIEVINEKELWAIIEYANCLCAKSKLIVLLLICTGIRRTELTKIRKDNINISKNRIYLISTKNSKGRYAYFDPTLKELILEVSSDNKTYLFEDSNGNHISSNSVSMIIKRIKNNLKIKCLTPHKLRHTYATTLLKKGCNIGIVRQLMGHSSLQVTHRYLDFTSDELEIANSSFNPLAK